MDEENGSNHGSAPRVDPKAAWRGRRVLVTGHTGFKGAWLCHWLDRRGAVVDGFSLAPLDGALFDRLRLAGRMRSRIGDVRDAAHLASAVEEAQPEVVFHLAGQAFVSQGWQGPRESFETNAIGVLNVLEAAERARDLRAIVVVTSDKCYRAARTPLRESDRLGGVDPYSASKACAELIAASYRARCADGAPALGLATARAGNVMGGGDLGRDRIVPHLIEAHRAGRAPELRRPGAIRPWQHVADALWGYLTLASALIDAPSRMSEAWNFGPETDWSVADLADRVARSWGEGAAPWRGGARTIGAEDDVLRLDASKARARLGWRPLIDFDEAIEWTVEGYRRAERGDMTWVDEQLDRHEARCEKRSLEAPLDREEEGRHAAIVS